MPDGQQDGNSTTAVAEPASQTTSPGQAAIAPVGTSNPSGEATSQEQSATATDSFTSIDPNTLSPELQSVYKQMQSDYTKKTMTAADTRKKAEAFDKVTSRSDFKDWWSGATKEQKAEFKEQKQEAEKRLGEKISDDDFSKAFESKEAFLSFFEKTVQELNGKSQKKIEKLEQQLSVKEAADVVESFATEIDKSTGKPVRPDFYELDDDQLISGFLQINQPKDTSQEAYISKLNEAYGWAKAVSQKYYEKGKTEALQIIQKKAAASTEPPTNAAKGAYTGPDPKKMSVKDAMELAKKGIRVPRDD